MNSVTYFTNMRVCQSLIAAFVMAWLFAGAVDCHARPLRIDLSMQTGRSNTSSAGWHEWQIDQGQEMARDVQGLQITLRAIGTDAQVQGEWYKAGFATGATIATDGVMVENGSGPAQLEVEIRGLAPGEHSLVTYHNAVSRSRAGVCEVRLVGSDEAVKVSPTHRVATNEAAESAYLEFTTTRADEPIRIQIRSRGTKVPVAWCSTAWKSTDRTPNEKPACLSHSIEIGTPMRTPGRCSLRGSLALGR